MRSYGRIPLHTCMVFVCPCSLHVHPLCTEFCMPVRASHAHHLHTIVWTIPLDSIILQTQFGPCCVLVVTSTTTQAHLRPATQITPVAWRHAVVCWHAPCIRTFFAWAYLAQRWPTLLHGSTNGLHARMLSVLYACTSFARHLLHNGV